jgi:HEAT repeat protein
VAITSWGFEKVPTKKRRKTLPKKTDVWERARVIIQDNDVKATPRLIKTLASSRSIEERTASAYALGFLHEKSAITPLLATLQDTSEDERVRGQAAEALAYICQFRPDPRVPRALTKALSEAAVEIRWSAFALGEIGGKSTVGALQELVNRDKSTLRGWWSVAKEAKAAIRRIGKRNPSRRSGN